MDEHLSIFYCDYDHNYLMCSDKDMEKLKALKRCYMPTYRKRMVAFNHFKQPFSVYNCKNGLFAMRVIYKPKQTQHMRRSDGYVDRLVVADDTWFQMMESKFAISYPNGLPKQLLQIYKAPDTDVD